MKAKDIYGKALHRAKLGVTNYFKTKINWRLSWRMEITYSWLKFLSSYLQNMMRIDWWLIEDLLWYDREGPSLGQCVKTWEGSCCYFYFIELVYETTWCKECLLVWMLERNYVCGATLGFADVYKPDHVCLFHKSLHGLK